MADDQKLFDGITAVTDAGGLEGFVREVKAETQTIARRRLFESGGDRRPDAVKVFARHCLNAFDEVVGRRLKPDLESMHVEEAIRALGNKDRPMTRKIRRRVMSRANKLHRRFGRAIDAIYDAAGMPR